MDKQNSSSFQPVLDSTLVEDHEGGGENNSKEEKLLDGSTRTRSNRSTISGTKLSGELRGTGQSNLAKISSIISFLFVLQMEMKRQRALTSLPIVYLQDTEKNRQIQSLMSAVFLRHYKPSLFIGTRSILNSFVAYAKPGPICPNRIREELKMTRDGATIALDWEFPDGIVAATTARDYILNKGTRTTNDTTTHKPITESIVLILHGVNTDTSYGYMRSMMNSCTNNGWIAVGMNARGYGQMPMTTPRFANAAYTNDLRNVVQVLCSRQSPDAKLFLVGFSMGANTVVKYLGESGPAHGLPNNVAGAISFCNPMEIDHSKLKFPWSHVLTLGGKRHMWTQRPSTKQMTCKNYQHAINRASSSFHCNHLDEMTASTAPYMIRNSPMYPYQSSIGYQSKEEYWRDASSKNYISNVSIPLLMCYANDDNIVRERKSMIEACLMNPNIIVVCTPCGGHIGWHCAQNPLNPFGSYHFTSKQETDKSWADRVAVKFISTLMHFPGKKEWQSLSFLDDDDLGGSTIRRETSQSARQVMSSHLLQGQGVIQAKL
jgi:predicted alpha/beta-fold hydrolase